MRRNFYDEKIGRFCVTNAKIFLFSAVPVLFVFAFFPIVGLILMGLEFICLLNMIVGLTVDLIKESNDVENLIDEEDAVEEVRVENMAKLEQSGLISEKKDVKLTESKKIDEGNIKRNRG